MRPQVILTSDNSHTLYVPELDETYHSQNGAVAESTHVYIEAGLHHIGKQQDVISIFEFGFGTGLNALLTWAEAEKTEKKILYHTVEKYPLLPETYVQLNYGDQLEEVDKLNMLHSSNWDEETHLSPNFKFKKVVCDIQAFPFRIAQYDLVYYDAFGPSKQSDVWAVPILEKVCASVRKGGVLVTYCSQGQFRRDLKSLGFEIEKLAGPKGKREMTRATKTQ